MDPRPRSPAPRRSLSQLRVVRDWGKPLKAPTGDAYIAPLEAVRELSLWKTRLWSRERHDHRHFEIVDATIRQGFEYRYLILEDTTGAVRAIQPFFLCTQNILEGMQGDFRKFRDRLNRLMPDLLSFRTLMVGSAVGEGVLAAAPGDRRWAAGALARVLPLAAHRLGVGLVVLKEFPSDHREELDVLLHHGFVRIPSLPYVTLDLDFATFDDHLASLSQKARYDFKRKARAAAKFPPLLMEATADISTRIDELYPLYLQVHERADLRFERLSPEYFRRLGREMRDRARFLIWSQNGRAVGFQSCILHDGVLWIDAIGMDYSVALDLHLYFIMKRDALEWASLHGARRYCGGPNNYDPKLRLGCRLKPMDLYATHVNPLMNEALRRVARWLSPARHEPLLQRFPNAADL